MFTRNAIWKPIKIKSIGKSICWKVWETVYIHNVWAKWEITLIEFTESQWWFRNTFFKNLGNWNFLYTIVANMEFEWIEWIDYDAEAKTKVYWVVLLNWEIDCWLFATADQRDGWLQEMGRDVYRLFEYDVTQTELWIDCEYFTRFF